MKGEGVATTCSKNSVGQTADADYALALKLNEQLNGGTGIPQTSGPFTGGMPQTVGAFPRRNSGASASYIESDEELARKLQEEENRRAGVY